MLHESNHKLQKNKNSRSNKHKSDPRQLGFYDHHRFAVSHTISTKPYTSSFLLHTPAEALQSSIFASHHRFSSYSRPSATPASILKKRRLHRQRSTTPMQPMQLYRGDQQPQIDDDDNDNDNENEVIYEFVPRGEKNHPVTVPVVYSINERDTTQRRI